jgi:hypothetical protein
LLHLCSFTVAYVTLYRQDGITAGAIGEGRDATGNGDQNRGRRLPVALVLAGLATLVVAFVLAGPGIVGLIALAALWIATTAAHLTGSTPPPDALDATTPASSPQTRRRR